MGQATVRIVSKSSAKNVGKPLQEKLNILLKYGPIKTVLDKVEDKTGCDRMSVVQCLAGLACLVTLLGDFVGQLVVSLLGSLYPAYFSLQALTTKDNNEQRRWLEYWLLSCILHCFDFTFGSVLCHILPLYWLARLMLVVWCIAPVENNGSRVLYTTCVWPLYDRVVKEVEKASKSKEDDKAEEVGNNAGKVVEEESEEVRGDGGEMSRDFGEDMRSKVEEANSNIVADLANFHDNRMDKKIDLV